MASPTEVSTGTFRILALDGGGIKGTFTAAILARWEEATKQRICDHFDLIAGTTQEPPQLLRKLDRGVLRFFKPGVFRWAPHLLGLLFEGQMESSRAIAGLLVGKDRFLRVNRLVPEKWFSLDSVGRIEDMIAVGDGLASEIDVLTRVKTRFLNGTPAPAFEPVYPL